MACTAKPCSSSSCTTALPSSPEAPVTSTRSKSRFLLLHSTNGPLLACQRDVFRCRHPMPDRASRQIRTVPVRMRSYTVRQRHNHGRASDIATRETHHMPRTLTSSFTTADWDEADIEGTPGALRHTTVHYGVTYIGEVAGSGTLDLLMVYKNERSVDYIGYEFFDGTICLLYTSPSPRDRTR